MALPRLSAYALSVVTVAELVAAVALLVGEPEPADVVAVAVCAVIALLAAALGTLVATRRPDNLVAPLMVLVGVIVAWQAVDHEYRIVAASRPGLLPVSGLYVGLTGVWMFLYVPAALLMLYFPDGRLPGRRWRWVAVGLIGVPPLFTLLSGFGQGDRPPPFQDLPPPFPPLPQPWYTARQVLAEALVFGLLALLVASAAAMVVRYRRAGDETSRAQIKWFALAAMFLPATVLLCLASYLMLGTPDLVVVGLAATFLAVIIAIAIAILRHDLYDVDRVISTAVAYGLVTAGLLGFYTVASFVGGLIVGRASPVAAAAATAVCAVVLAPLRRRLQRQVDRRLYPLRGAALTAIEQLRGGIHTGQARPEQLQTVLRAALRDQALRVGYRLPGSPVLVDAAGAPITLTDAEFTTVRLNSQDIGALVKGRVGSRELLREVATASALLVEVVRLRIELNQALHEVESSRARLLHAGYQERRRLERDLHDGAQQRLVCLGMTLRLAQRHLDEATTDVNGLLDQAVAELGTAVVELRQIAHGLRPSSLDDGLDNALATLAHNTPVPVTLDVRGDLLLSDDVATTAYYVASEATANAIKHAQADAINLRVARVDGQLTVQISDDGQGGAHLRPGTGLAGLADRVAAAGGSLLVDSPNGHGTLVQAVLPCAS